MTKYCKGYLKHKNEKRFLIYINVASCGSRCIKKNIKMMKRQPLEEDEAP